MVHAMPYLLTINSKATVRSDGMISVEYRHTNLHSFLQILDGQINSSAITHFRILESLTPFRGTLGSRRTQFAKYCPKGLASSDKFWTMCK
jgi:hypothetical protein